jgi:hypothetical protein
MPLSVADEPKANCSDPASRVACMHMSTPNNNVKLLIASRELNVMYVSQYVWESCVCVYIEIDYCLRRSIISVLNRQASVTGYATFSQRSNTARAGP